MQRGHKSSFRDDVPKKENFEHIRTILQQEHINESGGKAATQYQGKTTNSIAPYVFLRAPEVVNGLTIHQGGPIYVE